MGEKVKINRQHEEGILKVIKEHEVFSFIDVFTIYKKCSRATAYNHNLDKVDSIRAELDKNRRKAVVSMLNKWIKSDNPTLQIAAMRLICEPDERQKLNQQYIDHTSKGDKITVTPPKFD